MRLSDSVGLLILFSMAISSMMIPKWRRRFLFSSYSLFLSIEVKLFNLNIHPNLLNNQQVS